MRRKDKKTESFEKSDSKSRGLQANISVKESPSKRKSKMKEGGVSSSPKTKVSSTAKKVTEAAVQRSEGKGDTATENRERKQADSEHPPPGYTDDNSWIRRRQNA